MPASIAPRQAVVTPGSYYDSIYLVSLITTTTTTTTTVVHPKRTLNHFKNTLPSTPTSGTEITATIASLHRFGKPRCGVAVCCCTHYSALNLVTFGYQIYIFIFSFLTSKHFISEKCLRRTAEKVRHTTLQEYVRLLTVGADVFRQEHNPLYRRVHIHIQLQYRRTSSSPNSPHTSSSRVNEQGLTSISFFRFCTHDRYTHAREFSHANSLPYRNLPRLPQALVV